jgi:hypothetical protein
MATVLEKYNIEEHHSILRSLWELGLIAKDIPKELFPVYGGKCLSRKVVRDWIEQFSQERSKIADDARPGAEVAGTTVKIFLCCGFRRTGKAMGLVYQYWERICRELAVSYRFEFRMFYVLYPFVTFTDSPSYMERLWYYVELYF